MYRYNMRVWWIKTVSKISQITRKYSIVYITLYTLYTYSIYPVQVCTIQYSLFTIQC